MDDSQNPDGAHLAEWPDADIAEVSATGSSGEAELQLTKLRLEIAQLRSPTRTATWVAYTPLLTAMVACGTLAFGVLQFRTHSEEDFRKPFWEKQIEVYFEATDAAARIANSNSDDSK